jgi:hypothetical protein
LSQEITMTPNTYEIPLHRLASSLLCLALTACNTAPTAVDQRFGDAVKKAQAQQTLYGAPPHCMHPMDPMNPAGCPMADMNSPVHQKMRARMGEDHRSQAPDTDGVSAQAAVTRYQDSFKSPAAPAPVFNIGLGSASAR